MQASFARNRFPVQWMMMAVAVTVVLIAGMLAGRQLLAVSSSAAWVPASSITVPAAAGHSAAPVVPAGGTVQNRDDGGPKGVLSFQERATAN